MGLTFRPMTVDDHGLRRAAASDNTHGADVDVHQRGSGGPGWLRWVRAAGTIPDRHDRPRPPHQDRPGTMPGGRWVLASHARVFRGAAYFLPVMIAVLLLITYVPAITMWLPGLLDLGSGSP